MVSQPEALNSIELIDIYIFSKQPLGISMLNNFCVKNELIFQIIMKMREEVQFELRTNQT